MPNQSGPTSPEGKAKSSRNAVRHGLNNLQPVVTEASRPEYDALVHNLFLLLKPDGFLQELTFQRLVNAAWNMQRCLKLENQLREYLEDDEPLGNPETIKQAELYQRYYLRFEGSYRANLRELERLQRLQMLQDIQSGEQKPLSVLHDVELYQRVAKRNGRPAAPAPKPAEKPQPQSNQQGAKRNPAPYPEVGRNSPCPCGSGKKYKRCCGVNAPPILYAA
jgi:hypothetical protein